MGSGMPIEDHPMLGKLKMGPVVEIVADGETIEVFEGEPIAAALLSAGQCIFRYTQKQHEARGVFCAIGRCTDCMMVVDGVPNVRTCVTQVRAGNEGSDTGWPGCIKAI